MNEGWIKLHRQLKEWQHYQEPFVLLVWLDLLLSANMKAGWVRGNRINRGQLITSVARIMQSTGIGSDNTVRDALRKLEESGEIKREQIGIGTKITINHFNNFQTSAQDAQHTAEVGAEVGAQPTAYPGADKQEYKEDKKDKKERKNNSSLSVRTRYEKIFDEIYLQKTGQPFAWSRRECIAINAIIGKIAKLMEAQGMTATENEKEGGLRWMLLKLYDTGDGWITSNFVPHVINDKFNEYYLTIKNGRKNARNTDNPANVSEEWLSAILNRVVQS